MPNKNIQSKRIKIEHSNDDTRIDSFTQRQSPFDKERINPQEDYSSGEPDLAFRKSMRKTEFTETESQMFLESQSSKVSFKDISGYSVVKDAINESIVYPLIFPQLFEAFTGIVLLYGPPGKVKHSIRNLRICI